MKHDADDDSTDLAWQRALRQALAEPLPPLTDADAGLKRLMRRIDQGDAAPAMAPARRRGHGPLVGWLAAAVVVEAVGLSVLGAGLLWRDAATPAYQTLSAPAGEPAGVALRIVPAPALRADELQALLRGLDLQIVSGPNAAGAYGLALQARAPSEQQVAAKVAALRAAPGMRLVEPVGGPR
ncbi:MULTISPECIES: hypothetical protein [unclassified Rhizobacter]|uniref:hypothetical protein n=1 Tax=unclassified Rhizobacter TaxID=2640088 RepID=UPI0006F310F5|nr:MULTISPECIES: hypothetical protein [unclassified Rhizobacter]KQU78114.1 hypothetical protein ASC88_20020 [Rhizobacter sp. Root29]KQW15860.1 hypothetical protein ASC98_01240 [Rhizobacter sp. Root1238]KRB24973.1 hypothetical protein ASE08_01955 [Rhizobacter sp. Root16D2]